jgi:ATP synthase protein I
MADQGDEDASLQARRDRLAGELKAAKPRRPTAPLLPASGSAGAAWSIGAKAASEFVGAVIVGGAIGWGLDWLLHSKPAFTIIFFLLGVAAGVWGVIRATSPQRG